MARILNALQLALGGVGAGMSSYGRSMIDREERMKREAQQEEINEINRLNALRSAGFGVTTLPEEEAPAQAGTFSMPQPALPSSSLSPSVMGKALARATQQGMGVSERPTGTLDTPIRTALNATPVQPPARPTTQPMGRIKIGGMELGLESPEVVARRNKEMEADLYSKKVLADQQADIAKKDAERKAKEDQFVADVERLTKTGKVDEPTAIRALMLGGKYNDLFMSPEQREQLALRRAELALDREKFSFEQTKPVAGAKGKAGEPSDIPLPSILSSIDYFSSLKPDKVRTINGLGVSAASAAQQQGGMTEVGVMGVGAGMGAIGDEERRYAQNAGAIADAVARASEVGVLTNFDINRFRSQITFSPFESEKLKNEKVARARAWGLWLANNKNAIDEGKLDRISKTPESVSGYQLSNPGSNPYR